MKRNITCQFSSTFSVQSVRFFTSARTSSSSSSSATHDWRVKFEEYAKQNNIIHENDWYNVSAKELQSVDHRLFDQHFNGSLYKALCNIFPETQWHPWKFTHERVPHGFWKNRNNQRLFLDELGKKIGITSYDDWYNTVSQKVITENGGSGLLMVYHGSPAETVMSVYHEHNWIPWKFKTLRHGYWKASVEKQRMYFDWLGKELGIKELDDWYEKLSQKTLLENGGSSLLAIYKNSPTAALIASYPEHKWEPWKFNMAPIKFWSSKHNIEFFLSELSEKLSIKTLDDWYLVDKEQLQHFGGGGLRTKYKGLYEILKQHYPHHNWDSKKFRSGKKSQRMLVVTLKKMFPHEVIVEDYIHPDLTVASSKRPLQLDVFIPSKSLAFEYQGQQHYENIGIFGSSRMYQERDNEKKLLCASTSIKLVQVPYWWNRSEKLLQSMILEINNQ